MNLMIPHFLFLQALISIYFYAVTFLGSFYEFTCFKNYYYYLIKLHICLATSDEPDKSSDIFLTDNRVHAYGQIFTWQKLFSDDIQSTFVL